MHRLASIVVWLLSLAYAVSLAVAVQASARVEGLGVTHGPRSTSLVLAPLAGDARTRERVGDADVRRLCEHGRCELLVGRSGGGFELLASYPADQFVELRDDAGVYLHAVLPTRAELEEAEDARWLLPILLGAFLAGLLIMRGLRLRQRIAALRRSRPARVDDDGALTFLDAAAPPRAHPCQPLPEGPAVGLREAWTPRQSELPYRDVVCARWIAISGDRDVMLLRAARALGAQRALGLALVALTAAAVTLVLA